MTGTRYHMRDLNRNKIDDIMQFDVARQRRRSRSLLEFGMFSILLIGYVTALTLAG